MSKPAVLITGSFSSGITPSSMPIAPARRVSADVILVARAMSAGSGNSPSAFVIGRA